MKNTSNGNPVLASINNSMPATPATLAISCGSATTVVVPCGTITLASSPGSRSVLSRCMWASISPGRMA